MQWQVVPALTVAALRAPACAWRLACRLSPRLVQRSLALLSGAIATVLLVPAAQGSWA
jgi:hypothetical protein